MKEIVAMAKKVSGKGFQGMTLRDVQELTDITSQKLTEDDLMEMRIEPEQTMKNKTQKWCQKTKRR